MARILLYCMNGTGLGHVIRILAVSRQLRKLAPDTDILVLTSSENSGILLQEKIVSVKITSQETVALNQNLPIRHLASALTAQVFATF
jgi:predicted glycosyltransferase